MRAPSIAFLAFKTGGIYASAFLLTAILTITALAQSAPRPAQPAYRITGKVVDAKSGARLPNTSVQIADTKERTQSRTVITSDTGEFSFDNLPPGKYSLTASHRGYITQAYEEHDQYSTAIAVGPGLESEDLTFNLTPQAILTGTIVDESGEPIRNAQVRLYEDEDRDGIRTTRQRHSVVTDDRGEYEIADLPPGAYFLAVTARPWYAQRLHPDGGEPDAATRALDVAYPTVFYPGVTDEESATPIPVKGGERLEANLTLAAQQAIRLKVNLPQGTDPNNGIAVSLNRSIFGQSEPQAMQMEYSQNGVVEVDGILPGHYDVALTRYGQTNEGKAETKHFDAEVNGDSTEISEQAGISEVTVTGQVAAASGDKLPSGAGIALRSPGARRQFYAPIGPKGEFTLQAQPGSYEIVGGIPNMYLAQIQAQGAKLSGRNITLKPGDNPKLAILAGLGHGTISGTATLDGKPASSVMVLLAPDPPAGNQILFRRDQSDSDGTFTIQNIIPGRYRLLAIQKGWELEWANPTVLQAFLPKSISVEVQPNDKQTRNIQAQTR